MFIQHGKSVKLMHIDHILIVLARLKQNRLFIHITYLLSALFTSPGAAPIWRGGAGAGWSSSWARPPWRAGRCRGGGAWRQGTRGRGSRAADHSLHHTLHLNPALSAGAKFISILLLQKKTELSKLQYVVKCRFHLQQQCCING